MKRSRFEKLVQEAILILPKHILGKMDNIGIVIEKNPSPEQLKKLGTRLKGSLLGLYEGIPQTTWGRGFGGNLPDKITIFQEPIENFAQSEDEVKKLVQNVVWHEIAHHFGYSEKGIKILEEKRKINKPC